MMGRWIRGLALAAIAGPVLATLVAAPPVEAQSAAQGAADYPQRPVRIVVGFAPGGSTDVASRLIGTWLTERLGKQFVIENRPGTVSGIAAETVVRAPPDGHTLLLISSADTINATLHPKAGYNFLRDIAPVAGLTQQPQMLLANPSVPVSNVTELIAYAKANPGKLNIASAGNGSISHLAGELLRGQAGLEITHLPYRGAGPALTDLLAGHVQISFAGMAGAVQHVRSGRLKVLGVSTAARAEALPDVGTIAAVIPGYRAVSLFGIGAARETPAAIVAKLNAEINAGLADPKVSTRFVDLGGTVMPGTPQAFGQLLAEETERWAKVIRAANIKAE